MGRAGGEGVDEKVRDPENFEYLSKVGILKRRRHCCCLPFNTLTDSLLCISGRCGCLSGRYACGRYEQLFTIAGTQPAHSFQVFVCVNLCEFRRILMSKLATKLPYVGWNNSDLLALYTALQWTNNMAPVLVIQTPDDAQRQLQICGCRVSPAVRRSCTVQRRPLCTRTTVAVVATT